MAKCDKRCEFKRYTHDIRHERYYVKHCRTCGRKDYTPAHLREQVREEYWEAMFPRGVR